MAGMAKAAWRLGRHAPLARLSLTAAMDHLGLSPRLQMLLSMPPPGSMNCPPHRLPFLAEFVGGGASFPRGGGHMFASNLLSAIEQYGGEVVTRAFAEEIIMEYGRAAGVRLAGGATYRADTEISTADIKKTYNVLRPAGAVDASTMKRVDDYRMSAPFFNAFLGANVDLAATRTSQDSFSVPSWTSLSDIERGQRFRPGDTAQSWLDRICPVLPPYIHCSDIKDPTTKRYAPDGCSSLESMFPIVMDHRLWGAEEVDQRNHDYAGSTTYTAMKCTLTDVMVARTQTALPELDGHIIHREAATPLSQERYTQSTEGASYGIELSIEAERCIPARAGIHPCPDCSWRERVAEPVLPPRGCSSPESSRLERFSAATWWPSSATAVHLCPPAPLARYPTGGTHSPQHARADRADLGSAP
ncbi:phytoene desaturase family protein [Rhodococcoides fascians]|uniref:phytoene desaturase family protein n=1 Tax=Rhodococcoides fascians TaxID=1828 RepID=UPI0012D34765|nr:hypothetical protein [Rhodococcus fascians]